jgi:glycosyltransferase involved in cell wall biosynthesis
MACEILILTPNLELPGGVANFYAVARQYFSPSVKYLQFNSRFPHGWRKSVFNTFFFLRAVFFIAILSPKIVVVNPSLGRSALLRDGIFVAWAKVFKKKTVVFWRGWNPRNEHLLHGPLLRYLVRTSLKKANAQIVLSSEAKDCLEQLGVEQDRIFHSNTIVDQEFFAKKPRTEKDKFVVLFLTRIERYKGIFEAIEIFQILDKEDIELHIVGDGSALGNIRALVEEEQLQNIKVLGYKSGLEKIKAFKQADVYLFPSYSEGMPNSVLEAMATGLPVVCTRVGSLLDFFEDGNMGFSHELPIDVCAFAESILTIYSDPSVRHRMSEFNSSFAMTHFLASRSIVKLEEVLLAAR